MTTDNTTREVNSKHCTGTTSNAQYVEQGAYTCKNGYTMNIFFINYDADLGFAERQKILGFVAERKGWVDKKSHRLVLRRQSDAEYFIGLMQRYEDSRNSELRRRGYYWR